MTQVDVATKPTCSAAVLEMAFVALAIALFAAPMAAWAGAPSAMYRLYNPYTGEHFYTADAQERTDVRAAGWRYEGIGWVAPLQGDKVYRVYNPYSGDHHYTMDASERDSLVAAGWANEGVGWCSADVQAQPVYRQYNPNQFSCNHNYTASKVENDSLESLGWRAEGVGWYAQDVAVDDPYRGEAELDAELASLDGWWQSWGHGGTTWRHFVNGVVHCYSRFNNEECKYSGSYSITITRFETSDVGSGFSDVHSGGGWQQKGGLWETDASYLHFDDDKDNLTCSGLHGEGYSATSSYARVANPPQELVSLASASE